MRCGRDDHVLDDRPTEVGLIVDPGVVSRIERVKFAMLDHRSNFISSILYFVHPCHRGCHGSVQRVTVPITSPVPTMFLIRL